MVGAWPRIIANQSYRVEKKSTGILSCSSSRKPRHKSKNSLFNLNINESVGGLSCDIGDFLFSQTGGRVTPNMTVLVFEHLSGCFDPGFRTEPLREQAESREVVCPRI
jgi:hypothetical protein